MQSQSVLRILVREHIPLEQGLRRTVSPLPMQSQSGQRAYSIRTRIKTNWIIYYRLCQGRVREHIPLEQGLRRLSVLLCMA